MPTFDGGHCFLTTLIPIETDYVIYNGRMPTSALLDQSDRTIPQAIDQLPSPYLIFTADFDAPEGTDAELRAWLENVWTKMSNDLEPVFRHCFEFSPKVRSATGFADYVLACQVETTMPFNDYWHVPPPLPLPSLTVPML